MYKRGWTDCSHLFVSYNDSRLAARSERACMVAVVMLLFYLYNCANRQMSSSTVYTIPKVVMKYQLLLQSRFANKTPAFLCFNINGCLNLAFCHMNLDFATSIWGQSEGCRCLGCSHSLKMVHVPCCLSITLVTSLRRRLGKGGRKRWSYLSLAFTLRQQHIANKKKCLDNPSILTTSFLPCFG